MFGIGVPELIFIFLLALLIFGPKKLPEIGRTLGRGMAEFRKASTELTRTLNAEIALDENPAPPVVRNQRMETLREPRTTAEIAGIPGSPATAAPPSTEPAAVAAEAAPTPIEPA
jgi:sec-independent protein translocase protein TatA